MTEERWERLRDLFDRYREVPAGDRPAGLDRELGAEPELRRDLESLLRASDEATGFLEERPVPGAGASIGPFRLVEPIGEGGFAIVYLAERVEPIRRRVALKLIKPGMDSKQVLARFETERQALALMDHPGIAQVFDAGETEAGRPYFAMEYVPGAPITTFADSAQLSLRDRLGLFLQACEAIQHAHQKGVIHRDIKPSNLLVTRRDGAPALKVIDFGIAKATGETSLGGPAVTREGLIIGTAGYMSPEQLGAIRAPVDTRTDIYALGVLLYELLAGDLPHDREALRNASWVDAMQLVLADPPTPAERAARATTGETAEKRSTDARSLVRALKGELEWITLKAIAKEPERRYASASELAADIRRHLAGEPVSAAPPGALYRLSKYARRHRIGVTAAALVLVAITAGGIAATIGFGRAVKAERVARREAESAKQVAEFLVGLFHAASPGENTDSLTARALLDRGVRRIEAEPPGDPHVRARLLGAISDSYLNLEEHAEGLRLTRAALAAVEAARPRDDLEVARHLDKLANGFSMADMQDSVPPVVDRAIALLTANPGADRALLASCYYRKAQFHLKRGDLGPADSLSRLALATADGVPDPDPSLMTRIHSTRATVAGWKSELDSAVVENRRALEYSIRAKEPMRTAGLHGALATTFVGMGRSDSAMVHAQLETDMARRLYAPNHNLLAVALGNLAMAQSSLGHYAEAIAAQEEAVRIMRSKGKPGEQLAYSIAVLADIHRSAGRPDRAIALATEALAIYRASLGAGNFRVGETMVNLASYHIDAGHPAAAETLYRGAIDLLDAIRDRSLLSPLARGQYGNLCLDAGRLAEAEVLFARAWAALDTSNAGMRPFCGENLLDRARLRARQGRRAEADSLAAIGLRMRRADLAENDPDLSETWLRLAELRWIEREPDAALAMLARAKRSGASDADVVRYPGMAAVRKRPGYPFASSP